MHAIVRQLTPALALLILLVSHTQADMVEARIIAVHDGDTVTAQTTKGRPFRVRLNGIDAPELKQAFGTQSRDHLSAAVLNQLVILDIAHFDRYGRLISRILHAGRDENLEQIRAGCAWFYRSYQRDLSLTNRAAYSQAEAEARAESRGLWNLPTPLAPWTYRKQTRFQL